MSLVFHSRDYGHPDHSLMVEIDSLPVTERAGLKASIGSAVLDNGEVAECVYFADAACYIGVWGVWPEEDPGKRGLDWRRVRSVRRSAHALPPELEVDDSEVAMGGVAFEVAFADGTRFSCATGNATDFLALPRGYLASDVISTRAITFEDIDEGRIGQPQFCGAKYYWCLIGRYPAPMESNEGGLHGRG